MEKADNNIVESSEDSKKFSWYTLRVISGKEKTIEENIMYECDNSDVTDLVKEIFVPFEKVVEVRNNKKKIKEKMFFPGYILIQMEMTKKSKYTVENTPGVMSFVGPKGKPPVPPRDSEVKRIFGEVASKEGREKLITPFKKGDYVKVIAGPFIDFSELLTRLMMKNKK